MLMKKNFYEKLNFFGRIFLQLYKNIEQYYLKDHLQFGFFKFCKEYFPRSIPNLAIFKECDSKDCLKRGCIKILFFKRGFILNFFQRSSVM